MIVLTVLPVVGMALPCLDPVFLLSLGVGLLVASVLHCVVPAATAYERFNQAGRLCSENSLDISYIPNVQSADLTKAEAFEGATTFSDNAAALNALFFVQLMTLIPMHCCSLASAFLAYKYRRRQSDGKTGDDHFKRV